MRSKRNYITWFEFWHPGKAEALKSEEKLNQSIFFANQQQDELEARTSIDLTKLDNFKMLAIIGLGILGILLIKKYN